MKGQTQGQTLNTVAAKKKMVLEYASEWFGSLRFLGLRALRAFARGSCVARPVVDAVVRPPSPGPAPEAVRGRDTRDATQRTRGCVLCLPSRRRSHRGDTRTRGVRSRSIRSPWRIPRTALVVAHTHPAASTAVNRV